MALLLSALSGCASAAKHTAAMPDRSAHLARQFEGLTGCFVSEELNTGHIVRVNPELCALRVSPCSTFKIPHTLIGLDAGVIIGPDSKFNWDGSAQPYAAWEQDHTLRSAFAGSVVWWYQRMAPLIGRERMAAGLARLSYGNQDLISAIDCFWLYPGSLKISADEQVDFLRRLYESDLPFDVQSIAIVCDIMVMERDSRFTLSGKTGSGLDPSRGVRVLNWFVGQLTTPHASVVFACNIHSSGTLDGQVARDIALRILADLGYMPAPSAAESDQPNL